MGSKSEIRSVFKEALEQGWVIEKTGSNHWKFIPPDGGRIIYTGSTPSDPRTRRNFIAELRRGGLETNKR